MKRRLVHMCFRPLAMLGSFRLCASHAIAGRFHRSAEDAPYHRNRRTIRFIHHRDGGGDWRKFFGTLNDASSKTAQAKRPVHELSLPRRSPEHISVPPVRGSLESFRLQTLPAAPMPSIIRITTDVWRCKVLAISRNVRGA